MQALLFKGAGDFMALCVDDTGSVLPADHGPWTRLRGVELDHDGNDEEQARLLLREHGYCCFTAGASA